MVFSESSLSEVVLEKTNYGRFILQLSITFVMIVPWCLGSVFKEQQDCSLNIWYVDHSGSGCAKISLTWMTEIINMGHLSYTVHNVGLSHVFQGHHSAQIDIQSV